jgi:hypothetical protein
MRPIRTAIRLFLCDVDLDCLERPEFKAGIHSHYDGPFKAGTHSQFEL